MEKNKKTVVRVIGLILCVLIGIVLAGSIYLNSLLDRINRVDQEDPTLSSEEISSILSETDPIDEEIISETIRPEDVTMPTIPPMELEEEEHIINILLIGQDRRGTTGRQRSDAMILCTINTEKKTLVMTSFLRDLYVKYPEYNGWTYGSNRINATYVIGGMEMLDDCLELNFGVKVDHNIEVDFSGFEDIVDLVGGVDIELTQAEASWIGGGLTAGVNHLDGETALEYARIRKLDSDFARTNRQRTVLSALLDQVKSLSMTELTALANSIFPMITTDMTNEEIIGYVLELFPILTELEITTQHIPAEGTYQYANISGMEVILPDYEANIKILQETLG